MKSEPINLNSQQLAYLGRFIDEYTARTSSSQQRRRTAGPTLADPRSSAGYMRDAPVAARSYWEATKRMRYPLVGDRCDGSRVWDIDGNEFIDFGLGFGVHLFGHRPDFLVEAIEKRLAKGTPMGFQSDVANEVATKIARMTGSERVAFANTGTEAVMGAIRLAREVTGRTKIAIFSASYHGSYDATLPAIGLTRGIPSRAADETLVLEYGTDASLQAIAEHADQLAAVLIEPVQARQPQIQPRAFLHELRRLTRERDIAFILDDVLLGFRVHQGGCQAHFDVKADIATFGKIIGGGMPIGVVTGTKRFMDPVDGGPWNDMDDSLPEVDKIWFAGTFNKNPMTMATCEAVVERFEQEGPGLQEGLNERATSLVDRLNGWLTEHEMPVSVVRFGSMFRFVGPLETTLLIPHLALRGVYTWEGMVFFVSVAHSDDDLAHLETSVQQSLLAMRDGGYLV